MKLLTAKLGSNATPSSPRSPLGSTFSVTNGVGNSAPFLITRNRPLCSQTKMRPSGASSIAVGLLIPVIVVSVKFAGSVAAGVEQKAPDSKKQTARVNALTTKNPLSQ